MKPRRTCSLPTLLTTTFSLMALLGLPSAQAAIVALDFAGGNGTDQVDQYNGIAGSGWNTAWLTPTPGSDVSGFTGTVTNASPIAGGGNYLDVTYNTGAGGNRAAGLSRQWDTSGTSISMTDPISLSFYFRSDTAIQNDAQIFTIFGNNSATLGTGDTNSWRLSLGGGGLIAFSGTTPITIANQAQLGINLANVPLQFTLTLNPTSDTYTVSVTNLATSTTFTSGSLNFRNSGDLNLSFINIVSTGAANLTETGYSIDGFSITPVPEPSTPLLLLGAGLGVLGVVSRRRARAN